MIKINQEKCIGCGHCARDCFPMDIIMQDGFAKATLKTCIQCGHCIAICPVSAITTTDYDMSEVKTYDDATFAIPAETLLNFIKFRRSVRHFKDRPIEKEKLEMIIEAGRFTPTGSNKQSVSYIVIQDDIPTLTQLGLESLDTIGQSLLEDPNSTPLMKHYANRWKQWFLDYNQDKRKPTPLFSNANAVILVVSDSPIDGGLAASSMELMTNAVDLGMFYSGFFVRAVSHHKALRNFLGLDDPQNVIATLVLGYPDVHYERTVPRKKAVIRWK